MKKQFYVLLLALSVGATVCAQTRGRATQRPATTPAASGQARPAATPSQTPAPAGTSSTGNAGTSTGASNAAAADDCGCQVAMPDVLAVVNGVKITKADISPETQQRVQQLEQQLIEARKRELDLQIDSMLLEAEAKKRGVSTSQLLQTEVVAKTTEPTEADAQAFYDQNKARIQGDFQNIKADIISYLRYQRQQAEAKKFSDRLRAASQVKVLNPNVTPPSGPSDRARVFASVNGKNITSADIEDSLRPLVFSVQEQSYALRRQDVDLKINDVLLQQEAQKKGVTPRALLDTEVAAKVPTITDAQAQAFYNQNKERIPSEYAQVKDQIINYLRETEEQKLTSSYAQQLRRAATVQTFLTAPEPPVFSIATDDQPTKGNQNATVTVIEFTDYQCPSCAQAHPTLDRLISEYGDRVRFVVRDFPLSSIHADAFKAAEAAEAAREQGKYWEYTDILFRNQSALQVDKLKQYATALGLDRARFDAALDGGKFKEKVERDMLDGQRVGVNATPSFFINGKRSTNVTYEVIKAAIDEALKTPARR